MYKESYKISNNLHSYSIYHLFYYMLVEYFLFTTFNILSQKAVIEDASRYNSLKILSFFIIIICLVLLIIHGYFKHLNFIKENKYHKVNALPINSLRKFLILNLSNIIMDLIGLIVGCILSILTLYSINYFYLGTIGIQLKIARFLLPIIIPLLFSIVYSLIIYIRMNYDKKNFIITNHIFCALGILMIVCYILSTKSIIFYILFVVLLIIIFSFILSDLFNFRLFSFLSKEKTISYYNSFFSKQLCNRSSFFMQIFGITALFFCISIFVSSINAKQNHLNSSKYEYVLKDINSSEELGIAVNYLTTNNIQYTYLSEEKTIWIGDYCLSLYVTDLNSLDDFYAFDYDKKNEHMALSNSILLPSALAKDENLKVGDIIRIEIDNLYYDMKIEGFFNEVISLMAFSSPINGLEYNSYHYMLLNGIIDNNMIDKIELETSGDVIQREEAFLNQELPNKILDISAILVMTVLTILIILLYLFFKASTYKNQAPNNLLNIVDINIIYKKRSILAINFASLAYTFVAFLVSLFFIIPFLNTLFNSFNYINYAALSIVNYLTIVFSIFAFYIIINFMEYFIYNPKKDAYEKK